jgi:hypothetical protein
MSAIAFAFAFCIVALLVYVARYSGRVRVEQVRLIEAPIGSVWAQVADLHAWTKWNPWLEHEPDALASWLHDGTQAGAQYRWSGGRMSEARVEHTRVSAQECIEQAAEFELPFKCRGRFIWTFISKGRSTEVRWQFRGRVGFSLRAFAQLVQGVLNLEMRFGLDRIADLLEPTDAARYEISYEGVQDQHPLHYVFNTYRGPIGSPATAVADTTRDIQANLARVGIASSSAPLVAYFQTNIKLRTVVCQIGVSLSAPYATEALGSMEVTRRPAHRAYVVRLRGAASALELAWYHAMQRLRREGLEPDPRIAPLEIYRNHLAASQEERSIELILPLRATLQPVAA